MKCPICESTDGVTLDTRYIKEGGYRLRRRKCSYGHKFVTKEIVIPPESQDAYSHELHIVRYAAKLAKGKTNG